MKKGPSGTVIEMAAVAPPAPERVAPPRRQFRPFSFSRLEKLPRSQVELMRRLPWMLPEGLLTGEGSERLSGTLKPIFDEEVCLWLDYAHGVAPKGLPKIMSEPTVLGVIAPTPHGARGLVEVELALAHRMIDLLLGATGETPAMRPLTEIEEGVISYVLLETFKALSPTSAQAAGHRLRLERLVGSLQEGLAVFDTEEEVSVVEFKALIGDAAGYVRLLLPASTIAAAVPPEESPERRGRRLARLQKNLHRLGGVRAWLRAEIGGTELSGHDLRALRAGDVLLVDHLTVRSDRGEEGSASLRVGTGRAGRIEARVEVVEGCYRATVEQVVLGPPAPTQRPAESAPEGDEARGSGAVGVDDLYPARQLPTNPGMGNPWADDEKTTVNSSSKTNTDAIQADAAELLNDVPLQVVVELGRVPVTAEEVVAMHVGKIIELGRGPGEPVELSVNGRIVARGELVEIEGQLGVRISSLAE